MQAWTRILGQMNCKLGPRPTHALYRKWAHNGSILSARTLPGAGMLARPFITSATASAQHRRQPPGIEHHQALTLPDSVIFGTVCADILLIISPMDSVTPAYCTRHCAKTYGRKTILPTTDVGQNDQHTSRTGAFMRRS